MAENINLIRFSLNNLNNIPDGDETFQKLAVRCVEKKFAQFTVFPSSGSAAGGDGGYDGYCVIPNSGCEIKIAASIDKDKYNKINQEIKKIGRFSGMVFCTNQVVDNNHRNKIIDENKDLFLSFLAQAEISEIVSEDSISQRILDIPRIKDSLKIDYLRDNDQLIQERETIKDYIPRKIVFNDEEYAKYSIEDFLNNRTDLNVCVVDAPAGYGKTGFLKYLYYNIVYKELSFLPPFFISLDKGYRYGDVKNTIDQVMSSVSSDNYVQHFVLLIDGLDELSVSQMTDLMSEISFLLNISQAFTRLVVLSGRTGEYSSECINSILGKKCCCATIRGLNIDDINQLINLGGVVSKEDTGPIYSDIVANQNSDNIFFVTQVIGYLNETGINNLSLVSLLNVVSEKNLESLFKNKTDEGFDIGFIERKAFEMTKHRILVCSDTDALKLMGYEGTEFKFSHKSIQEFLGARYLSHFDIRTIIEETTSLGLIIPHLKNLTGLLLNIMAQNNVDDFICFEKLLVNEPENYYTIFKIDASFISREIRVKIIKDYLISYDGYDWNRFDNSAFLRFASIDSKEIISFILQQIQSEGDKRKYVRQLIDFLHYSPEIEDSQKETIRTLAFSIVSSGDTDGFKVSDYIIILSLLRLNNLSAQEVQILVARIQNDIQTDAFDPVVRILLENISIVDQELYLLLLRLFFEILDYNSHSTAHFVPQQITSDTEFPESRLFISTYHFPKLIRELGIINSQFVVLTLKYISELFKEQKKELSRGLLSEKEFFSAINHCLEKIPLNDVVLCESIINIECCSHRSLLFKTAINRMEPSIVYPIIKRRYLEDKSFRFMDLHRVFGGFIGDRVFHSIENYYQFKSVFSDLPEKDYDWLLSGFLNNDIADDVKGVLDDSLLATIEENNKKQEKERIRKEKELSAFHVAFNKKSFIEEVLLGLFNNFPKQTIPQETVFRLNWNPETNDYNDYDSFAISVIEELYRAKKIRNYKSLVEFLEKDYEYNIAFLVCDYLQDKEIDSSLLSDQEKSHIDSVIITIFRDNPYNKDGKISYKYRFILELYKRNIFRTLIVRCINNTKSYGLLCNLVMSVYYSGVTDGEEYSRLISDFQYPLLINSVIDGMKIYKDVYSLNTLCKFIHFAKERTDCCDDRIEKEFVPKVFCLLKENLSNTIFPTGEIIPFLKDYYSSLLCEFSEKELCDGLVFDDSDNCFLHTPVYELMSIYTPKDEKETIQILGVLSKKFKKTENQEEKRNCIELILYYNHADYSSFVWLAKYLIKNKKCVLSESIFGTGYKAQTYFTNSRKAYQLLNKLYQKSFGYKKVLKDVVQKTVLNSYRVIAKESCHSEHAINKCLYYLCKLRNKDNDYAIDRSVLEIREKYVESLY